MTRGLWIIVYLNRLCRINELRDTLWRERKPVSLKKIVISIWEMILPNFILILWLFGIIIGILGHGLLGTAAFFMGWYLYRLWLIFGYDTLMEAIKHTFTRYVFLSLMIEVFAWSGALLIGIPIQLFITSMLSLTFFERMITFPGFWIVYYLISLFKFCTIPMKWLDDYRESQMNQ